VQHFLFGAVREISSLPDRLDRVRSIAIPVGIIGRIEERVFQSPSNRVRDGLLAALHAEEAPPAGQVYLIRKFLFTLEPGHATHVPQINYGSRVIEV
jgi:hypothetical protein